MSENQVLTSDDLILPDEEGGPMQRESMAEGDAGFLA